MRKILFGAVLITSMITLVPVSEAHRRSQPARGFNPSDRVLECVRSKEQGAAGYATNTGNGYYGAYQMGDKEWRAWSTLIPDEHWLHHRVSRASRAHEAPPVFQDEAARNGIRARGLHPWPTPNRVCPREVR